MIEELIAFIEARVAEEEAEARHYSVRHWRNVDDYTVANDPGVAGFVKPDAEHGWGVARTATVRDATFIARHDPARVLRQCEAARRIVHINGIAAKRAPLSDGFAEARARQTIRLVGTFWSDHPDYREAWAPA